MTLEERKQRILEKIIELQTNVDIEKNDMQNALELLGVAPVEELE